MPLQSWEGVQCREEVSIIPGMGDGPLSKSNEKKGTSLHLGGVQTHSQPLACWVGSVASLATAKKTMSSHCPPSCHMVK